MADYSPELSKKEVNIKYLKDENGNIFSPISSAKSVYMWTNTSGGGQQSMIM